ncbi:MAG: Fic family protein [Deltaproteobacteria bacterium]|nr:Fic family protein [Deltaproteobacteria bacterium]
MPGFLNGLDPDIGRVLLAQLRNLWTHTSTALEGNTLTLGETAFVIEEGLTVSGKPLKDHQEVVGHARAIDLIYDLVKRNGPVIDRDLFLLHQLVQTEIVLDVYQPVGDWKKEPNGTYRIEGDQQIFFEYAAPEDVPALMTEWLHLLNGHLKADLARDAALTAYVELHVSFVRVHPFFDGNERMARLVSNLPVIRSGFPPIVIPREQRRAYLLALRKYEALAGTQRPGQGLLPITGDLHDFKGLCGESWKESLELVDQAREAQANRTKRH